MSGRKAPPGYHKYSRIADELPGWSKEMVTTMAHGTDIYVTVKTISGVYTTKSRTRIILLSISTGAF